MNSPIHPTLVPKITDSLRLSLQGAAPRQEYQKENAGIDLKSAEAKVIIKQLEIISSPDTSKWRAAYDLLFKKISENKEFAIKLLRQIAGDGTFSSPVRIRALEVLEDRSSKDLKEVSLEIFSTPSFSQLPPKLQVTVCAPLAKDGNKDALKTILSFQFDPRIANTIPKLLKGVILDDARDTLIKLALSDTTRLDLRQEAIKDLSNFSGDKKVTRALVKLLKDSDVNEEAGSALGSVNPKVLLKEYLATTSLQRKLKWSTPIALIAENQPELIKPLWDSKRIDIDTKVELAIATSMFGEKAGLHEMLRVKDKLNEDQYDQIVNQIAGFQPIPEGAFKDELDAVLKEVQAGRKEPSSTTSYIAARILEDFKDPRAFSVLIRGSVIEQVRNIGSKNINDIYRNRLNDPGGYEELRNELEKISKDASVTPKGRADATTYLSLLPRCKELNIIPPFQFELEVLEKLIEHRTTPRRADERLAVVVFPTSDYNGAFNHISHIKSLLEHGWKVRAVFASNPEQMVSAVEEQTRDGRCDLLVVQGHGQKDSLLLGSEANGLVTPASKEVLSRLDACIKADGTVVLSSCSTANGETKDSQMATGGISSNMLRTFRAALPSLRPQGIFAPTEVARGAPEFVYDSNGAITDVKMRVDDNGFVKRASSLTGTIPFG